MADNERRLLVEQAKAGGAQAWETLLRSLYPRLAGVAHYAALWNSTSVAVFRQTATSMNSDQFST